MKFKLLNKNGDAEVLLYDEIGGGGFFADGVTAKQFAEALNNAGTVNNITLRINSPGGDVFDGLTIYNTLHRHPAKIRAIVEGLAGSIASVILQAADERVIADNAFVMIHEPHAVAGGTAEELRNLAGVLDRTRDSILDSYVKRAGENRRAALSAAMTAETWYTAGEAFDAGLVDSVDVAIQAAACVNRDMMRRHEWKNTPRELLNEHTKKAGARLRVALGQQRQRLASLSKPD